ncbi:MAG: thrombospondin type 3 repeat-containing protein [Myxococcota bacterium]
MRRTFIVCALTLASSTASSRPTGPDTFCDAYPSAPVCASSAAECSVCHSTPPALNVYGQSLAQQLGDDVPSSQFDSALLDAFPAVSSLDSDGDGFSNEEEILWGADPADPEDFPREIDCSQGLRVSGLDPCAYDPAYALRKISLDFCGRSPTRESLSELQSDPDPLETLHQTLDACLNSEWWLGRDGVLWRLAHRKIRPLGSLKAGEDTGDVPLGDYEDDYNLFVYSQIDGHDARELLTAKYFVARADGSPTVYTPYEATPREQVQARGLIAAQRVERERRAGILTHDWFVLINTMFTAMPRTTAAQAYRAFLGYDLSKLEGLYPVSGEPVDYDNKRVTDAACALCHSTLDPLTYPFARYEGLGGPPIGYNPDRLERFVDTDGASVVLTPDSGSLLGQPVADLVEWGEVAANSDAFARATVLDYWRLVFGEDPRSSELEAFDRLWQDLAPVHGYSVESMLHALIETEAYGVP